MAWESSAGAPTERQRSRETKFDATLGSAAKAGSDSRTLARLAAVADAKAFHVRSARAALPEDEEKLHAVIETSGEAVEHFLQWARQLFIRKTMTNNKSSVKYDGGVPQ